MYTLSSSGAERDNVPAAYHNFRDESNSSKPPKLLGRLRHTLRTKHYAYSTEKVYVGCYLPSQISPSDRLATTHEKTMQPAGVGVCCCKRFIKGSSNIEKTARTTAVKVSIPNNASNVVLSENAARKNQTVTAASSATVITTTTSDQPTVTAKQNCDSPLFVFTASDLFILFRLI